MQKQAFFFSAIIVMLMVSSASWADIIYASATYSTTPSGLERWFGDSSNPNWDVTSYMGSTFQIDQPVDVTAIGGHFHTGVEGTVFGAIIALDTPGFPPDVPFHLSDVVASTTFHTAEFTGDYRTSLSVSLVSGDYAIIFGSSMLGASGGRADLPFAGQSWLDGGNAMQAIPGASGYENWQWSSDPVRFVVEGTVIPEPATLLLLGLGSLGLMRKLRA